MHALVFKPLERSDRLHIEIGYKYVKLLFAHTRRVTHGFQNKSEFSVQISLIFIHTLLF